MRQCLKSAFYDDFVTKYWGVKLLIPYRTYSARVPAKYKASRQVVLPLAEIAKHLTSLTPFSRKTQKLLLAFWI